MRRAKGLACCACLVLLGTGSQCTNIYPFLPGGTAPAEQSNLELMDEAEQIVGAQYPSALLIEAWGSPSAGTATVAADIDQWRFISVEDVNAQEPGTVTLDYASNEFGEPEFVASPWVGTVYERLPRQISLAQAIEFMRNAGHTDAFAGVTLRKPLTWPQPEEALYSFSLPGMFVLVGALTGEVQTEIPQD